MSLLRQLSRGLRALTKRDAVDAELTDEVEDFYVRAAADLESRGLSSAEAERAATRALGARDRARESLRDYGWENVVTATVSDCGYAFRGLRRSPGFAVVAVVTLALGIGASTAILSAVKPILIEPLPYPNASRVIAISDRDGNGAPLDVTYGNFIEVEARSRSFDALAVADRWRPSLVGGGESIQLDGDLVSAGYFSVLGVAPAVGRDFSAFDDVPSAAPVAILTQGFAERRFGSAEAALDAVLELDGSGHRVVGVMPRGFENLLAPSVDVWAPRRYRAEAPFDSGEWGHHLRMVGRLASGVTAEQAQRELQAIGAETIAEFPRPEWSMFANGLDVESLQRSVTADARPVLLAILCSVLLLLAIACGNVTNLLLARSVRRRGELAVRSALGAGRGRIVRQLFTESLCLAALGGALGLPLALAGIEGIVALAPVGLPRAEAIRFDSDSFLFALLVTTLAGIAVGFVPALGGRRTGLRVDLAASARLTGETHHAVRRTLVVAEIALALVLLVSAGLLYRSVAALLSTPAGFSSEQVLTMQVIAPPETDLSPVAGQRYFQSLLQAVQAVPGVEQAAFSNQLPLSGDFDSYGVLFESSEQGSPLDTSGALRYAVTPEWFDTMGIPLLDGRLLAATDSPGSPPVVLINESYAERRFEAQGALGEKAGIGPDLLDADSVWREVVGIVGDVKHTSLALAPEDAVYFTIGQWPWVDRTMSLAVRSALPPELITRDVQAAIRTVDPTVILTRVTTLDALVGASEAERQFTLTVFLIFSVAAVVLAAVGLYGVMAGSVEERRREIGLRAALGAAPADIVSHVVRQGLTLTGIGIVLGTITAVAATRGLESMLFGITALDPLSYVSTIGLVVIVTVIACSLPARRASRIDPTQALRSE